LKRPIFVRFAACRHAIARSAAIFALVLAASVHSRSPSQEEMLAGYDQPTLPFTLAIGAGTGPFYGDLYGMGGEIGYGPVSLVVSGGMGTPTYNFEEIDGSGASVGLNDKFLWRVGIKGYLGAEESRFRPFLGAVFGPLYVYNINWYGDKYDGTFSSIGGVAGCDWDPGDRGGITFSLGLSAFILTSKVPEGPAAAIRIVKDEEAQFVYPSLLLGMNYRF
jgi:hypothetical protein